MATAVLRSENCLNNTIHRDFLASSHPTPAMRSSRKKPLRSPPRPRSGGRPARNPEKKAKSLVMEEVTILRRGELMKIKNSHPKPSPAVDLRSDYLDLALISTKRIGPDPSVLPRFSDLCPIYAGPSVVSAPSPNSLPFPASFLKKAADEVDLATKGLRCLLRLDISG